MSWTPLSLAGFQVILSGRFWVIAEVHGGSIEPHYVGETKNERRRMCQYACYGSHLSEIIAWHLRQGWCLYYRGIALPTKAVAVEMQNRMLARFWYDWNQVLNRAEDG